MMAAAATMDQPRRPARPPSNWLALAEAPRALGELAAFIAWRPLMRLLPRGDGHGVLVLPGFMASDTSTAPMRSLLTDLGYDVMGWDLGRNIRIDNARVAAMSDCLRTLYERTGRKVSIVGWSLGGLLARELAKLHPEMVRQVISLGSPLKSDRGYSNASKLFEAFNGKVTEPERDGRFRRIDSPPPVPSTSVYTRTDGVVAWRGSLQPAGKGRENVEVYASHVGLGVNPSVMLVIADRLAQAEGKWAPFKARGLKALLFPLPRTAS
ncbi:MAG TPA: alpha/beta hydrolase [Novosphingobium sp.]|nr:alpha/beta hydrolase [Novosphingobium sp.]